MIIRFSTPRALLTAEGISPLDSRSLGPEVIISRELCRYVAIDFRHVPPAQRRQALQHQVESHSPWSQAGHHVVWRDGVAQLWLWDARQLEQRLAAREDLSALAQLRFRSAVALPETLFRTRPAEDGVYLQVCSHGHELQHWRAGVLQGSRWYLSSPDTAAVQWFLRSQGLDSGEDVHLRSASLLEASPWPGSRPPPWQWLQLQQRTVLLGVLLLSLFAASLQATAGLRWWSLERDYQQQAAELQASANSLLEARGEARRAALRYAELRTLFNTPGALSAQQQVTARMPEALDYQVVLWERIDRAVEMVIKAEISDTLSIVRALSGNGIADVTVEPWRQAGHYSIRLKLAEQAGQGASAGVVDDR